MTYVGNIGEFVFPRTCLKSYELYVTSERMTVYGLSVGHHCH